MSPLGIFLVLLRRLEQIIFEPVELVALGAGQIEEDTDERDNEA